MCSCTGPRYFQPAAEQNANTEVLRYDGKPYIRSILEKTEVSAQLIGTTGRSLVLDLFFYNDSDVHFSIDPAGVLVTGYNEFGIPATFRVFKAEEYIKRRNTRNAIIGGAVVVASVASAIALSESAAGGNALNNQLFWWSLGAVPSIVSGNRPVSPYYSDDGLARPHALFPETAYRGNVMIRGEADFLYRVEVRVPVNGMWHRFDFVPPVERYTR